MLKNKHFLFFPFLLLVLQPTFAQNEKEALSLKIILEDISIQHDIKFNFIEDEIVLFNMVPPPKEWELAAKIDYIKSKTQLRFNIINRKYYNIYNDKKVDKPLCGYLIDAELNTPIENAVVNITNTNSSTFSDSNGYFELPIISPNAIEIRHQGYQLKNIEASSLYVASCPKLKLTPITQELVEVVAQNYLTNGIGKKRNGTIEIRPKQFGILPGLIEPDILQTLQQLPGINSVDETISNINVRGGTHDQNLFLWNGVRMFQTGHFFGLISAFNASLPHKISITKSGTSAFYGESVSSFIDISTHAKAIEDNKTSFSSNMISGEFYTKSKLSPKASLEISGRRSFNNLVSTPTYLNYRDRVFQNTIVTDLNTNTLNPIQNQVDFYFYDLTAQYQQKIGKKHELTADIIVIKNSLKVDQTQNSIVKNSKLEQQNSGGNISWKTDWNSSNTSQINVSGSYYNLDSTNESIENNQVLNQQNMLLDFGFQLKNTHQLSPTLRFNNGYQYDEIGVLNKDEINTSAFSRNIKEVSRSHVGVAEMEFRSKNNKTLLTFGTRLNYFDKFHSFIVEPRIQWQYKLTKDISLDVLGEQKNQSLSQIIDLQQDFLGVEKRRWMLANNSTIPIQKSHQISVGFTYKINDWLVTLDNFYKNINGITTSGQGFQNQFEFEKDTGQYKVLGTELLFQKNFKKCYAWLSYTFNQNRYTFKTLNTDEFSNNYELVHAVNSAFIYDWKSFKIALGSRWHSGKPITTPASNNIHVSNPNQPKIDYNTPNNSNLSDYFQLNFSTSKDWKLTSKIMLQTSFSVLNILNKKNVIQRFYRINVAEDGIERVNTYSLSRTPNINVKVSF